MEELFFRIIEFLEMGGLENYLIFATIGADGGIGIAIRRCRLYSTVNKRSARLQGASKWYVNRVPTSPLASTLAKYPSLSLSVSPAFLALRKLH